MLVEISVFSGRTRASIHEFKVQLLSQGANMNPAKKQYEVKYKKIQLKDLQFDQGDNVGSQALTLPQRYFPSLA